MKFLTIVQRVKTTIKPAMAAFAVGAVLFAPTPVAHADDEQGFALCRFSGEVPRWDLAE